jgi:hypothetical protein
MYKEEQSLRGVQRYTWESGGKSGAAIAAGAYRTIELVKGPNYRTRLKHLKLYEDFMFSLKP